MLYRPSAVDSVTDTFTSWPWGKKGMAMLTAWTEHGGPSHGGRLGPSLGPKRGVVLGMEVEAIGEALEVKNTEKILVVLTLAFLAKLAAQ